MTKTAWTKPALVLAALATAFLTAVRLPSSVASSDPLADAKRASYRRPASIPYPASNPYSAAKAELGRALFFDNRISYSQTRSCASCHAPALSWSDGLPIAGGEGASAMKYRTPTLYDIAWLARLGWDGKFRDIEAVTFGPILAPSNVHMTEALLIERIKSLPAYDALFKAAFSDGEITRRNIELAIATYERSIVSAPSAFDRWVNGDDSAIGPAAKRGFVLFNGKGRCAECHSGWSFTDGSFHDIGAAEGEEIGRGRYFPTSVKLRYAFKTPTLRDVARRGPYMHNGSIATLQSVIDLYDKGGIARPSRSELIKPLGLTASEKDDLLAFLMTLDDDQPSSSLNAQAASRDK